MSREIIEVLSNAVPGYHEATCPHPEQACTCSMKPQVELMAPAVERLLADEREKVRDMCANKARSWYTEHEAGMHGEDDYCFPCSDGDRLATHIRQLALTKLDGGKKC